MLHGDVLIAACLHLDCLLTTKTQLQYKNVKWRYYLSFENEFCLEGKREEICWRLQNIDWKLFAKTQQM